MEARMLPNGNMLIPVPLYGTKAEADEGMLGEGMLEITRDDPRWNEYDRAVVKINDEPDCGNAPRREILKDLVIALAERDTAFVAGIVAEDIVWTLVGDRTVTGSDAVQRWVDSLPQVDEVTFGSTLTHGRGASVDGLLDLADGSRIAFCHVLRFSGAAKTAKIAGVNSYLVA